MSLGLTNSVCGIWGGGSAGIETMSEPEADLGDVLSETEIITHSSLFRMSRADAVDEMITAFLEYRIYCNNNGFEFLGYLCGMAALEAMNARKSKESNSSDLP